jgi:hypothetical protein
VLIKATDNILAQAQANVSSQWVVKVRIATEVRAKISDGWHGRESFRQLAPNQGL